MEFVLIFFVLGYIIDAIMGNDRTNGIELEKLDVLHGGNDGGE